MREIIGCHASSGNCETLTDEERCSLVELLQNNCFRTKHPLLNCKYSEVVGIRANIYLFIDDNTEFLKLVFLYS